MRRRAANGHRRLVRLETEEAAHRLGQVALLITGNVSAWCPVAIRARCSTVMVRREDRRPGQVRKVVDDGVGECQAALGHCEPSAVAVKLLLIE